MPITLTINGQSHTLDIAPNTPLLYVLRNDLELYGAKYGCGGEQCGACKVLIDGRDIPSCQLPVKDVVGMDITTLEGLGTPDALHPLQETFIEEQAAQCGYCTAGMIVGSQGLLNRTRYPSDDEIRDALQHNLCRCGVYDRVRRAIRLRIGRLSEGGYEMIEPDPIEQGEQVSNPLGSLDRTPNLDAWIRINDDETVTIFSGKAELGQGIKTALAQIAAEELDVSLDRVQVQTADTGQTPDEGGTTGSMSVERSGNAIRLAGATARHHLLSLAFEQLESATPAHELDVADGVITDLQTGRQTTYWELMGGKRFGLQVTGTIAPKDPETYSIVGQASKRIDLLNKVTGQPTYVHDMTHADILHARVLRPPTYHSRLIELDESQILALDGVVKIVRNGSFVAIVADREEQAIVALEKAREIARWQTESLPSQQTLYDNMLSQPTHDNLIVDGAGIDDPIPDIQAPYNAVHTMDATYRKPFTMHGSLGPSASVAQWDGENLTVWCPTQAAFLLQSAIADVLQLEREQVRVIHSEGAGCYGHNGADDVGLDAALIALEFPNQSISLKWMREDEHRWEPYGSAMILKMQAGLNNDKRIVDWNQDIYSYGHATRPTSGGGLLASWHLENPLPRQQPRVINGYHFGSHRNADPLYNFPKRIVRHELEDSPVRVSALRSLGAYANVFGIESFMDELAHQANVDPLEFRLNHLTGERAKAVLQATADRADWYNRTSGDDQGWGIAFARYKNKQTYCAIAVQVEVNTETGKIHLKRAVIGSDSGQIVNPDGLSNQLEGGFVQAASWTLFEQVDWDENGILSHDWETYPILSFPDAPVIETVILNRPTLPFMGVGEASQNPTPAAIANAVYRAVGVRLRDIPFTPDAVLAEIKKTLI